MPEPVCENQNVSGSFYVVHLVLFARVFVCPWSSFPILSRTIAYVFVACVSSRNL